MTYRRKHINPKIRGLKKRKRFYQMPMFWLGTLFVLMIGTVSYFTFFFPKFQITQVTIFGNEKISTQDLKNIALADISKNIFSKSFLMVDTKNMMGDILHAFPEIETVGIQKKFPETIMLTIKERVPFTVFCQGESLQKCFFMDINGVIFQPSENVPEGMFTVNLKTTEEFTIGQTAVSKNIVDMISSISKKLKDNHQINIKSVVVGEPLIVTTSFGWQIYFDPTKDTTMQITKMDLLLKNEITPTMRKSLNYIYLQYKDRAYYK